MLDAAGVAYHALPANVDEDAITAGLLAEKASPERVADALAELKAIKISQRNPSTLVLGADSVLAMADGTLLDKPLTRDKAATQLRLLSGKTHQLVSAAVIAEAGTAVWRAAGSVKLTMRSLSDAFIEQYLDAEGDAVLGCVGCYRIEGLGAQLFSRVDGDQFTVRGLPLLAVLDYLRTRKVLAA